MTPVASENLDSRPDRFLVRNPVHNYSGLTDQIGALETFSFDNKENLIGTPTASMTHRSEKGISKNLTPREIAARLSNGISLDSPTLPTPRAQVRQDIYNREDYHYNLEEALATLPTPMTDSCSSQEMPRLWW